MYKKGDIHIGDPYYHVGKDKVLTNFHINDINQIYIKIDNPTSNIYVIGYKKQLRKFIDDLEKIWQSMKD